MCSIEESQPSVQDIGVEVEKFHSSRTITKGLRISGLTDTDFKRTEQNRTGGGDNGENRSEGKKSTLS